MHCNENLTGFARAPAASGAIKAFETEAQNLAKMIDGDAFKNMITAAAAMIEEKKDTINALNVFPVPDGDTGTNMAMTLNNAAVELARLESPTLGRALEVTSSALLRGARGNSGVITSLLFRGVAKNAKDGKALDGLKLAEALSEGSATAYKAVMKPAEGTILTVSRVSSEAALKAAQKNRDPEYILGIAIASAKKALAQTTEQNPVLKKAGVVDAGGYGYVLILEAMQNALSGTIGKLTKLIPVPPKTRLDLSGADFSSFHTEEITFAYCTEFIAERRDRRRSPQKLREYLGTIGDCVVVVDDDEIVKVHVHTDTPDKALAEGLRFGGLSAIKIENMQEQLARKTTDQMVSEIGKRDIAEPEKRYGFVSVCSGDGVEAVFSDLGADQIVQGGQTMNPSTEDILAAVDRTPAEVVYILPNNKNIVMAAMQAASLSQKQAVVIATKSIPQGICAMLAFEAERDIEQNTAAMNAALESVRSGQITRAARDSEFDGKAICRSDFLALEEGKLCANDKKLETAAKKLAKSMCRGKPSFITILTGVDATAAPEAIVRAAFAKEGGAAEINVIAGGQPVYPFIISVES